MSLPVIERPYRGSRILTPSDTGISKCGKAIQIVCTSAGNVSMQMTDGSTLA